MSTRAIAIAIALALALASPVRAAPEDLARAHYDRGMQRYNLGDFDGAITEFDAAYAVSKAPGLLFNLAQAHRLARHHARAVELYREYLRLMPRAANRHDVEQLIEQLGREIEATPAAEPQPAPEPVPTPTPAVVEVVAPAPATPPPAPKPRRALVYAGAATTALGLGALGAGLGLGLSAQSASDRLSAAAGAGSPWSAQLQNDYDAGQTRAHAATAMYVVGGVITATGVVLLGIGIARAKRTGVKASSEGRAWAHGY